MRQDYKILVFPHVQKFMLRTYPHKRGVFMVSEANSLGKLVTMAITKYQRQSTNDKERDRKMVPVILRLTSDQLNSRPRLWKLYRLNLDVDDVFKEHLLVWIASHAALGASARSACINFLEHYKIDETEYALGSAYKHWQRTVAGDKEGG